MDMSLFTSFDGRINRQKWWVGLIVLVIAEWIIFAIISMLFGVGMMGGMDPENPQISPVAAVLMGIIGLVFLYPALALYAKRWHDRGKSGWWTLIGLVPIIGGLWILVELGFLRGTEGPNQYGNDPLGS